MAVVVDTGLDELLMGGAGSGSGVDVCDTALGKIPRHIGICLDGPPLQDTTVRVIGCRCECHGVCRSAIYESESQE